MNLNISGVYKIQSKVKPSRIYIGSTINFRVRWGIHKINLKNGSHHSRKLQNHYNKYGPSDLQFSVLVSCEKEALCQYEQFFMDLYNPFFNNLKIAGSSLGRVVSLETRKKLSQAGMGHVVSKETLQKISEANKGRKNSDEVRRKLSAMWKGKAKPWLKGKPLSDEHKRKISAFFKGRTFSDETKLKISQAGKLAWDKRVGWHHSEETKKKISETNIRLGRKPPSTKGRIKSEETRRKLSWALTGRPSHKQSEETRSKISMSLKGRPKSPNIKLKQIEPAVTNTQKTA